MNTIESYLEITQKCTRCGNCQYYCPSFNANHVESYVARGRLELIKALFNKQLTDYSDLFTTRMHQCLLCGNCSQNCPSGIKTEEIIEAVRAACVSHRGPAKAMELTAANIANSGSITGDAPENRLLWFKNVADRLGKMKISQPAEYAYFTGCVAALYPSSYSIPQAFASILTKAGLDFTLVGEAENCCGYPLFIGGMPDAAKAAAQKTVDTLTNLGVKQVITTCPSCYHMWKVTYPEFLGYTPALEVKHGTQLLEELALAGKLPFKETKRIVTYHDPCDLGRKSGIYDPPRQVLRSIPGLQFHEMKHSREDARCCGGGGNLEMNDAALGNKVAQDRIRQAMATGADTIVTACQQCKRTLQGGARQMKARIKIVDLSELILESIL